MFVASRLLASSFAVLLAGAAWAADDDYRAQRLALAATPGYSASVYQSRQSALLRKARDAWSHGNIDASIVPLDELLDFYPLSILGHAALAEVLTKRAELDADAGDRERDAARARSHHATAEALVASITQGTHCASIADGCRVINIPEEYEVIRALGGGRNKGQAVLPNGGVPFDVVTVEKAPADGGSSSHYFDISPFFSLQPSAPAK